MSNLSKIINKQYQDQAADLIHANPLGPVEGFHLNSLSNNQSWTFINRGGNLFSFRNESTGTYAAVEYEGEGAPVVGSHVEYIWRLVPVIGAAYKIETQNGRFSWLLRGPGDYAPIVLRHSSYEGKDAEWVYRPTARVD